MLEANSGYESAYLTTYDDVMGLYNLLKESNLIKVQRAEFRQGECTALPIDYCADVELKTKRAFNGAGGSPSYDSLFYKEHLGKVFLEYNLHKDGAYKELFRRTEGQR